MKYLGLLMLAAVAWWLWGRNRRETPHHSVTPPRPAPAAREDMVRCAHCGVYLPQTEALPGRGGVFCDAAHRLAHESKA